MSLQSIIWVFLLNNFSRIINLLLTKLARDRPGRISALGLFSTDRAQRGPYCQDLGPIFSQYGPRAWLIRYMNYRSVRPWMYLHTVRKEFKRLHETILRADIVATNVTWESVKAT